MKLPSEGVMSSEEIGRLTLPRGPGTKVSWIVRTTVGEHANPTLSHVPTLLDIERTIDTYLTEHTHDVASIEHTLTSRTLHLHDGSTTVFEWEPQISDWRCMDCGIDTDAISEYYMLHDPLWQQLTGHLCIRCVEHRLGRTLTAADFTDLPINTDPDQLRSPRLAIRLRATPPPT